MRRRAKPSKAKVESERPAAPKSPKSEGSKGRDLEERLAEALKREAAALEREAKALGQLQTRDRELVESLDQQTATSEILRAISRAQTDAQPVFDIIAESAQRLCGAGYGQVALYDGELLHMTAFHNISLEGVEALRRRFPARAVLHAAARRKLLDRRALSADSLAHRAAGAAADVI